ELAHVERQLLGSLGAHRERVLDLAHALSQEVLRMLDAQRAFLVGLYLPVHALQAHADARGLALLELGEARVQSFDDAAALATLELCLCQASAELALSLLLRAESIGERFGTWIAAQALDELGEATIAVGDACAQLVELVALARDGA